MIKSNGGIIGPDNVTTGGAFGTASGVFKLGEVTNLIKESKWPTAGPQGHQVANSCRFNSGSSDYLSGPNTNAGSTKTKFTFSAWIKRSFIGNADNLIIGKWGSGNERGHINFSDTPDDSLIMFEKTSGSNTTHLVTNRLFRDVSAWYHIVYIGDTTQGTAANRLKLYVNGVQETSFSTATYPAEDSNFQLQAVAKNFGIGSFAADNAGASSFDGYMSEVVYLDGIVGSVTDFGEFNSQTGIWVPKVVTGLTFGTNGFYQNYSNSGALGEDFSGEDNDFTVNNLTSIDQSTDTCSTNFATMNPLVNNNVNTDMVFREGNLYVELGGSGSCPVPSTIGLTQGKWYAELKKVSGSGGNQIFGVTGFANRTTASNFLGNNSVADYGYQDDGEKFIKGSQSGYGASYADGDIIGIALDLDTAQNTVTFYKNGASQGSIDIDGVSTCPDGAYFFAGSDNNIYAQRIFSANFGSPPFAISSGNTDGNGFGNFEYAVPTGFLSLNTKNLAAVLA